jgi:hypothetical protein
MSHNGTYVTLHPPAAASCLAVRQACTCKLLLINGYEPAGQADVFFKQLCKVAPTVEGTLASSASLLSGTGYAAAGAM